MADWLPMISLSLRWWLTLLPDPVTVMATATATLLAILAIPERMGAVAVPQPPPTASALSLCFFRWASLPLGVAAKRSLLA